MERHPACGQDCELHADGVLTLSLLLITGTYYERSHNAWGWQKFWQRVDEDAAMERFEIKMRQEDIDEAARYGLIQKNYGIIKKCKLMPRNPEYVWRKRFAVYRLYRFLDVPINEISYETGIPASRLQDMIGRVFAYQCSKDRGCVFRKYLKVKLK